MDNDNFYYFIIFDNNTDAMCMHDALDKAEISNKISPAPLDIVEGVCCGVSVMIEPIYKNKLDDFLMHNKFKYKKIIKANRNINSKRDRYC